MIVWVPLIKFVVPGEPVGKGRPRASQRRGSIHFRTPEKTVTFQRTVQVLARAAGARPKTMIPKGVPIRLDVIPIFHRPGRLYRKADPPGLVPHTGKPDIDNVFKACADALNDLVYKDDAQICSMRSDAFYHEKDGKSRTEITVYVPKGTPK